MALQASETESKNDLLSKVLGKQLSLKELKEAMDNIKRKKMCYRHSLSLLAKRVGSLLMRYPQHATN